MYNLSGIRNEIIFGVFIIILAGLVLMVDLLRILFITKKWNKKNISEKKKKRKKKIEIKNSVKNAEIIIITILLVILICNTGYDIYKYNNPNIVYEEGFFHGKSVGYRGKTKWSFWFDEDELKTSLYLYSMEEIYPDGEIYPEDFSKDIKYRIYYEKDTKIIVKVEELD